MKPIIYIALLLNSLSIFGQSGETKIISQIVNKKGVPLPGFNIVLKGTTIGTVTDSCGQFELIVPDKLGRLHLNCISYDSWEVDVNEITEKKVIIVIMDWGDSENSSCEKVILKNKNRVRLRRV